MAAARAGHDHIGATGQEVEQELLVGRDRVEAGLEVVDRRLGQRGDVPRGSAGPWAI